MRSYYSHLTAVKSYGEEVSLLQKPTYRSSAIFPVIHNLDYTSKITFMGYWLLKRNIKEIGLLYTLRDKNGKILNRKNFTINTYKSYEIQMAEFFHVIEKENFIGSLELEIFSSQDLVFPYPAFVLVYYNDKFSTAVHTTGRIYNDLEDLQTNTEYRVMESGFDIYNDPNISPFIAFTNGSIENAAPEITYELLSESGAITKGKFQLEALKPFETCFLEFNKYIDLKKAFGNDKRGMIKVGHNFEGFFPRFVSGNFETSPKTISITHTYYNCSDIADNSAYWVRHDDRFNDSATSVPLYLTNGFYTRLALYPIFSPSNFTLSLTFFDKNGKEIKQLPNCIEVISSENKYSQIDFKEIANANGLPIEQLATVLINCNWADKTRIPTRIKFGLNIGMEGKEVVTPSNICFAPKLGNPKIALKSGTFKWTPFINLGVSEVALTNGSPLKLYNNKSNVVLKFYRNSDEQVLTRNITIEANGLVTINSSTDKELFAFFENETGWMTAEADSPYVDGYYFDFHETGAVAADHIF